MQDERLNALEAHIRVLTEIQQQNQLDITENNILLIEAHGMIAALQDQVGKKVDTDAVDPALGDLNDKLSAAREKLQELSQAASESWATLQNGIRESADTLRTSAREARARLAAK
jgi:uncharacterized coiled-coil DUF342 family protein